MQTILGSNGVIGMELAQILPHYTKEAIRLVSRHPKHARGNEELLEADLLNPEATDRAVAGSTTVYVTVGLQYDTKTWQKQWPTLMQNIISSCAKHGARLVFFDNVYMYGVVDGEMTEETPANPTSLKGEVRAQIAAMVMEAVHAKRIEALIARSADFYGPGADKTFAKPMIFDAFRKGKRAAWLIDAHQPHSMTYTKDAARGLAVLGNSEDTMNQIWHLPTSDERITGEQFIEKVASAYGVKPRYNVLSPWMLTMAGWFDPLVRETREMAYQFDRPYHFTSRKFTQRFFEATPYEEAIAQTVAEEQHIKDETI